MVRFDRLVTSFAAHTGRIIANQVGSFLPYLPSVAAHSHKFLDPPPTSPSISSPSAPDEAIHDDETDNIVLGLALACGLKDKALLRATSEAYSHIRKMEEEIAALDRQIYVPPYASGQPFQPIGFYDPANQPLSTPPSPEKPAKGARADPLEIDMRGTSPVKEGTKRSRNKKKASKANKAEVRERAGRSTTPMEIPSPPPKLARKRGKKTAPPADIDVAAPRRTGRKRGKVSTPPAENDASAPSPPAENDAPAGFLALMSGALSSPPHGPPAFPAYDDCVVDLEPPPTPGPSAPAKGKKRAHEVEKGDEPGPAEQGPAPKKRGRPQKKALSETIVDVISAPPAVPAEPAGRPRRAAKLPKRFESPPPEAPKVSKKRAREVEEVGDEVVEVQGPVAKKRARTPASRAVSEAPKPKVSKKRVREVEDVGEEVEEQGPVAKKRARTPASRSVSVAPKPKARAKSASVKPEEGKKDVGRSERMKEVWRKRKEAKEGEEGGAAKGKEGKDGGAAKGKKGKDGGAGKKEGK
ncbi:hypothetical protein ACLMJK_008655 [Lecanora helva]